MTARTPDITQAPCGRWYVSEQGWGRPYETYREAIEAAYPGRADVWDRLLRAVEA